MQGFPKHKKIMLLFYIASNVLAPKLIHEAYKKYHLHCCWHYQGSLFYNLFLLQEEV